MSSPHGETPAAPPARRIPPQTTVTAAPESNVLPISGGSKDRPPLNGSVRPAPVRVSAEAPAEASRAGVVTRLLAAVVDAVAVVVLAALLDLGAAGARFVWSPADFRWPQPSVSVVIAILPAVAVVYLTVGWALAGRTYGAKLMGLRVLSTRQELVGWFRSVLRALVCVVWPIGLLWCGVDRSRRSVADLAVRTVVVYDTRPYARVRAGG